MKKVGIICEYNPFHNGHVYHLQKVREMFKDALIVLVMSGNFTERGDVSIINKWDKTKIALAYGVDLVVELPFPFACESADTFAMGAIKILSLLDVDYLVFGSESDDIKTLENLVNVQLYNTEYEKLVKEYLDLGNNYPASVSKALLNLTNQHITSPNDLLGLCYIKQIKKQDSKIIPLTIKRTSDFNSSELNENIVSAKAIRKALNEGIDIKNYVPVEVFNYLSQYQNFQDNYFKLLKYKIISDIDELDKYQDVSEGIDKRIKKYILSASSYQDLIEKVKTKRYTYNRLNRMFLHIILGYTKEKSQKFKEITYIRLLGFNILGREYIKKLKKETTFPIITNYSDLEDEMLSYELRTSFIYSEIIENDSLKNIELKSIPIQK